MESSNSWSNFLYFCSILIQDVICSSSKNIIDKSAWLVKSTLKQSSATESKAILDVLNNRLPGVMQRLFLTDENDIQGMYLNYSIL